MPNPLSPPRREELIKRLQWVGKFIEYARYELQPGVSQLGDQFPRQADADKAIAEVEAIAAALSSVEPAPGEMRIDIHMRSDGVELRTYGGELDKGAVWGPTLTDALTTLTRMLAPLAPPQDDGRKTP